MLHIFLVAYNTEIMGQEGERVVAKKKRVFSFSFFNILIFP